MGPISTETTRIAQALKRVEQGSDPRNLLITLLMSSLSPMEMKAYSVIAASYEPLSAHDLTNTLKIKLNNAGNLLKRLYDYGLITRSGYPDYANGSLFYYSVNMELGKKKP